MKSVVLLHADDNEKILELVFNKNSFKIERWVNPVVKNTLTPMTLRYMHRNSILVQKF